MFEKMYSTINGVWNLSSEQVGNIKTKSLIYFFHNNYNNQTTPKTIIFQGNLGAFIMTNIRLVWYAESNETFNISLPYIHINSVS